MSLLAGLGLEEAMKEIDGELLLVGTPAEETNGAKVEMADKGVFDGLDLALMIHSCGGRTFVPYEALAMDAIEFTFHGKPAHAAGMPWEGRNALNGVQLLFHAIDMLRQHVKPDVRMHGYISSGGVAPNIVPDLAVARFYFRAPKRAYLDIIVEQVYNCARGAALATATEVEWKNFEVSFDDMVPNPSGEAAMTEVFQELGVPLSPSPGPMGSSDVGNVSHSCPALQPEMDISAGRHIAAHTREFAEAVKAAPAHEALVKGAKAIGRMVLKTFLDPELRRRMKEEHAVERNRI
jgi:amidohydrolase